MKQVILNLDDELYDLLEVEMQQAFDKGSEFKDHEEYIKFILDVYDRDWG